MIKISDTVEGSRGFIHTPREQIQTGEDSYSKRKQHTIRWPKKPSKHTTDKEEVEEVQEKKEDGRKGGFSGGSWGVS